MSASAQFEQQSLFQPRQRDQWKCPYRIPNLLVSRNGVVFALPEERVNSVADEAKNHLVVRRSFDHGCAWTDVEVLFFDDNPRVSHSYSGAIILARFNLEWLRGVS